MLDAYLFGWHITQGGGGGEVNTSGKIKSLFH